MSVAAPCYGLFGSPVAALVAGPPEGFLVCAFDPASTARSIAIPSRSGQHAGVDRVLVEAGLRSGTHGFEARTTLAGRCLSLR